MQDVRLKLNQPIERCRLFMVFDGRWKYIHASGFRPMLYDLAERPAGIRRPRRAMPSCADVIARLQAALFDWALHPKSHITISNEKIAEYADTQRQVKAGVLIGIWDEAELAAIRQKIGMQTLIRDLVPGRLHDRLPERRIGRELLAEPFRRGADRNEAGRQAASPAPRAWRASPPRRRSIAWRTPARFRPAATCRTRRRPRGRRRSPSASAHRARTASASRSRPPQCARCLRDAAAIASATVMTANGRCPPTRSFTIGAPPR